MPQMTLGGNQVAHSLLENLDVRKSTLTPAVPYGCIPCGNHKLTCNLGRPQCHLLKFVGKGMEQLLSHPGTSRQPVAGGTVGDGNREFVFHDCCFLRSKS